MAKQVCRGAVLRCSFGTTPSILQVIPQGPPVQVSVNYAATIMDHKSMANILPFGLCSSLANPTVASATSAAMGVLTPMPCIPATTTPWVPGSPTILINNIISLNDTSKCMCNWAGVITIEYAGQPQVFIP